MQDDIIIMNGELGKIREEILVVYFKIVSQYFQKG
jgi:hypothetical protein